jgi:hypothetical protein
MVMLILFLFLNLKNILRVLIFLIICNKSNYYIKYFGLSSWVELKWIREQDKN